MIIMDGMEYHQCTSLLPSEDTLYSHNKTKHTPEKAAPWAKIKMSHVLYAVILIAIFSLGYYLYSMDSAPGQYDGFAKCIAESGARFYGAFWCPHCADQKAIFGQSAEYLPYIECSTADRSGQTQTCIGANIRRYPTWEFKDGSRIIGEMTLQELGNKTGCPA
ncbi:MAG: hypothetical protein HY364_03680 [Candidatus Aenigmarchaeota archaeon]|nr:hypothetical protein [Candidatus Aenigmarchaeota archaeon]